MRSFYLWLAIVSLFTLGLSDSGRGPIFPDLLQTFELNDSRGALFFFTASLCALLNNMAAGHWLPRFGPYRALQAFLCLQIGSQLVLWWAPNYGWVLAGSAVFGVALSGLGTTQNIIVAQTADAVYVRRAFALLHCMFGAASFVSPLLVSSVFRSGLNWQNTFLIFALFPAFILVVSLFKPPHQAAAAGSGGAKTPEFTSEEKRKALWICSLVTCYVFAELILSTRLVLYLRRDLGYSVETANDCLAAFFGLMLLGRVAFAFAKWKAPTLTVLKLSAALSLALFVLGLLHHPYWLAVSGLAMAPFFPGLMALAQENFGISLAERAFAWIFTAHAFGIMTMHVLTGWFSDVIGLGLALYFGPAVLGVALVLLLKSGSFPSRK